MHRRVAVRNNRHSYLGLLLEDKVSQLSALMTVWLILIPAGLVLPTWDEDVQTQRLASEFSHLMLTVARLQRLFRLLRAALGSEMQNKVGNETIA